METTVVERRQEVRVPFRADEGLFAIIRHQNGEDLEVSASVLDISRHGILLGLQKGSRPLAVGDTVQLMQLLGVVAITFEEPVELVIRWHDNEGQGPVVRTGCEITRLCDNDRLALERYVASEMKWKIVSRVKRGTNSGTTAKHQEPAAKSSGFEEGAPEATAAGDPSFAADPPRQGFPSRWAVIGNRGWSAALLLICSGIVILSAVLVMVVRNHRFDGFLPDFFQTSPSALAEPPVAQAAQELPPSDLAGLPMVSLTSALRESTQVQKELSRELREFNFRMMRLSLPPLRPLALKQVAQGDRTRSMRYHVVKEKENLFRIALRYGTTIEKLCELNGLQSTDIIRVGQKLIVP